MAVCDEGKTKFWDGQTYQCLTTAAMSEKCPIRKGKQLKKDDAGGYYYCGSAPPLEVRMDGTTYKLSYVDARNLCDWKKQKKLKKADDGDYYTCDGASTNWEADTIERLLADQAERGRAIRWVEERRESRKRCKADPKNCPNPCGFTESGMCAWMDVGGGKPRRMIGCGGKEMKAWIDKNGKLMRDQYLDCLEGQVRKATNRTNQVEDEDLTGVVIKPNKPLPPLPPKATTAVIVQPVDTQADAALKAGAPPVIVNSAASVPVVTIGKKAVTRKRKASASKAAAPKKRKAPAAKRTAKKATRKPAAKKSGAKRSATKKKPAVKRTAKKGTRKTASKKK